MKLNALLVVLINMRYSGSKARSSIIAHSAQGNGMQIIVTGGRNYQNKFAIYKKLDCLKPSLIIQGGCPTGADLIAREYAEERGVDLQTILPNWVKFGAYAGPKRNKDMIIRYPQAKVVFFPGGRGTKGCVAIAREYLRELIKGEE